MSKLKKVRRQSGIQSQCPRRVKWVFGKGGEDGSLVTLEETDQISKVLKIIGARFLNNGEITNIKIEKTRNTFTVLLELTVLY